MILESPKHETPTEGMLIRQATKADARSIAELVSQLGYPSDEREMSKRLAGIHCDPYYQTLVAQAGTVIVGVVGVGLAPYYERNGLYARVLVLAVDRSWHRKGIGQALMKAAEKWSKDHRALAMLINSGDHRRGAHRFYERCGYAATGVRFVKKLESSS